MIDLGGYGGRNLAGRLGRSRFELALQRLAAQEEDDAASGWTVRLSRDRIPESLGSKDVLVHAGILLANTDTVIVAPGIANIHARDPMAMANGASDLGEAYPGRFALGIGVSHAPSVQMRGGNYGKPLSQIEDISTRWMRRSTRLPSRSRRAAHAAALGPRMLELAAHDQTGRTRTSCPSSTRFARHRSAPIRALSPRKPPC